MASPLVTRICSLIASTQGMASDDPLQIRWGTAGQKAIWALCMMPCAWDQYFTIDTVLFDEHKRGLPLTALLAVQYQAQRWCHRLLRTLHTLLANQDYTSPIFRLDSSPLLGDFYDSSLSTRILLSHPFQELPHHHPMHAPFTWRNLNMCIPKLKPQS
jgi:hypothetical protein